MMPVFKLAWSCQFLNWHGPMNQKTGRTNKRGELFALHTCIMLILQYFPPFVGHFEYFKMLNDAKVASLGFFI